MYMGYRVFGFHHEFIELFDIIVGADGPAADADSNIVICLDDRVLLIFAPKAHQLLVSESVRGLVACNVN